MKTAEEMLALVERFRQAVVEYAQVALAAKADGRTVAEADWEATTATGGLTRSVPLEVEIWLRMAEARIKQTDLLLAGYVGPKPPETSAPDASSE